MRASADRVRQLGARHLEVVRSKTRSFAHRSHFAESESQSMQFVTEQTVQDV